jgi:hypothetical protein
MVIQNYLSSYFTETFQLSPTVNLTKFTATLLGSNPGAGTANLGFNVSASFPSASDIVPTKADLDVLLQTALSAPKVAALIKALAAMNSANPLSTSECRRCQTLESMFALSSTYSHAFLSLPSHRHIVLHHQRTSCGASI